MPAITVAPVPYALRAAHRDCESYMVATLLQVTVQLPLVRLQVLSYAADQNDNGQYAYSIPIHIARRGLGHVG